MPKRKGHTALPEMFALLTACFSTGREQEMRGKSREGKGFAAERWWAWTAWGTRPGEDPCAGDGMGFKNKSG